MTISPVSTQAVSSKPYTKAEIILGIALIALFLAGYGIYRAFRTQSVNRTFEAVPIHLKTTKNHEQTLPIYKAHLESLPINSSIAINAFDDRLNHEVIRHNSLRITKISDRKVCIEYPVKEVLGDPYSVTFEYKQADGKQLLGDLFASGAKADTLKCDIDRLQHVCLRHKDSYSNITTYTFKLT